MKNESLILSCSKCNAKNRIPVSRLDEAPKCGKCASLLRVESLSRNVNVSDQTFDGEVLKSTLPVLVDCWAPWCGPCRAVGPILDQLAKKYRARLKIAKLNLDENPLIGSRYSITSVPTMFLVKKGKILDTIVCALGREELEYRIKGML
jgi:thioredoxin 2